MTREAIALVPRLRFPEFTHVEWKTIKFGDIASRGKEVFDPRKNDDRPHLIELENIEAKTGRILYVTELEKKDSVKSRFQTGDVLFGKLRPYLQKFARPDFQGVCTMEIWVLRGKKVSSKFLICFNLFVVSRIRSIYNNTLMKKSSRCGLGGDTELTI